MTCPESRVAGFIGGTLSPEEERSFDAHLLECQECWTAVREDRLGRAAAARLREPASPALEDRIRIAVSLASQSASPARHRRRPRRTLVGVAATVLVFAGVGAGVVLSGNSTPTNPAPIVAVLTMARSNASIPALRSGEALVVGGQRMLVRAYTVDGLEVLAATSASPFAMPVGSHLLAGSSSHGWMASSGTMSLYGVNHARGGRPSMFVVAAMPMAELPEVAAELKLL